jgi:ligand-binding sensor domain-containing protein/signal transduction histidine kinase
VTVLLLLAVLALSAPASAAQPPLVMAAWTEKTGLPPGEVLSIAQDLDGFLWLGTTTGLVRFDGATFVTWGARGEPRLPGRSVPAMVSSPDGSLWVGYGASGGVSRIHGGTLVSYTERDGVPQGPITALLQDRSGAVWAAARGGLARFRNGRWGSIYADREVASIFEDRTGVIWTGTSVGVFSLSGEAPTLREPQARFVQHFAEDAAGTIWITDFQNIVRTLAANRPPPHTAAVRVPQSGWRLLRDRRGAVWVAALGGGLLRFDDADRGVIDRVPYEHVIDGAPRSLFSDREGNVWVGMRPNGLLRLSEKFITTDIPLEGVTNDGVRALMASADGGVWIGTGHSLHRFADGRREIYDLAQTRALHEDALGTVWAATTNGLNRIERGRLIAMAMPGTIRWDRVVAMATDTSGALWICSSEQGLMTWRTGELTPLTHVPGISSRSCTYLYTDRDGQVWAGFGDERIAVHSNGVFRSFGAGEGLAGGAVLAILQDRAGVLWAATRDGVSRYRNGRFTAITRANGPFDEAPVSLVEDLQGFLWLGVNNGAAVLRFDPREIDKLAVDASRQIEYRLFDLSDGMQGDIRPLVRPSGVRATDGRLWFASGRGVVIFETATLPPNQRPGPPRVERALVEGRSTAPVADVELPNGTSTVAIEYTTASVGAASKLRFRYRLDGRDADWVQAGTRRAASYENLPPGRYRFLVSATSDGVWTEAAVWPFAVAPPIYRRSWFLAAAAFGTCLLLVTAWWLRLAALRRQYALVFEERTRVSREIHDTLLQSLAAIGVELETIASQLYTPEDRAPDTLRQLRRQVGHSLRDARDSVWGLRHHKLGRHGLIDAVRELADATTTAGRARVELTVDGRPRRCSAELELQLLQICREAVTNAVRHGSATHIHIVVGFRADAVVLTVSDNGSGFVVEDGAAGDMPGEHLGLLGMRERAERIRGRLLITSSPGQGTIVEVTAPIRGG